METTSIILIGLGIGWFIGFIIGMLVGFFGGAMVEMEKHIETLQRLKKEIERRSRSRDLQEY